MRLVDDLNASTAVVSTNLHVVEDSQGTGCADYPRLFGQSQTATEVTPGTNVNYGFQCDDVDTDLFSSDDDCDKAQIRWRRLDDGTTGGDFTMTGIDDNSQRNFNLSFPSQGYYVVEAQLANENGSFPDVGGSSQGWWRIGNAAVNDAASSLSGSISLSGVQASSPPSVNPGAAVTATATAADAGGSVQAMEWDADGNGAYERLEYTVPTLSGGDIVHPALSLAARQQAISTSAPGLKTVNVKVTDNGALDAADNIRRQLTVSQQLRVNAIPTAGNQSVSTNEDTAKLVSLTGNDSDNQPSPLTYNIVSAPPASAGSLSAISGNQVTFTPAPNFNGTTSFTYNATDGPGDDGDAFATSNTATVTITVIAVNDPPTADPKTGTTNEDTPITIQATGGDVEDAALSWSVQSQPTSGAASCTTSGSCTYTPDLNFNGTDSFIVEGTDSGGLSATATWTITVNAVNDAPIATDDTVSVPEDSVNFPITLTGSDVDSAVLTFSGPDDDVDHGTLNCLGQSCTYSPAADYNGPDSFTFTVTDDGNLTDSGTITIDVTAVNDAPVATDVPDAETDEDTQVNIATTGTDVDNDPLSVSSVTDPPHGSATNNGGLTTDYLGDLNFNGIDVFDFVVTDGVLSDVGHVTVTVRPVNDAPVVEDQTFHVNEDTPALLSVAAGDVDGDALRWSIVSGPTDGALFGRGPDVGYSPGGNFNGSDSFVIKVDDGRGLANSTDTAVITVIVDPVNDQPDANAGVITTPEDTNASFSLEASDLDGDTLTVTAPLSGPSNGTLSCTGASCMYTPNPDFNGSDLFTFGVDDGHGASDSASISIKVTPVNDAPVASAAAATTNEDQSTPLTLVATDVDGDALSYDVGTPTRGVVQGIAPNLVYTPSTNSNGVDHFNFSVSDGHGGADTKSIDVTVKPVNDAPIATGGSVTTAEDTTVAFELGASDVENDPLTFSVLSAPEAGATACGANGACTYNPPANFHGTVTITYSVSDGQASDSGVFTVVVDPQNDPPVATDSATTTNEDTPVSITLSATDTEDDALAYNIESPPSHGTLTCASGNSSCVYTPAPNYNGADAFSWSADDGHAGHANATVALTVKAVNDAPDALDVSADTDEETTKIFPLMATDVDGDPITYTVVSAPSHGTLSITGNQAKYTPAVDFNGLDTFVYRASDGQAASTANGTLTVVGLPLIGSRIKPDGGVASVEVQIGVPSNSRAVLLRMSAILTSVANGAPLGGRRLDFSIGDRAICWGITDAKGFATCGSQLNGISTLLNLGYRVAFAGDADYSASANTGPIVTTYVQRL
jgi:VCBS repeat-containing protein